MGRQHKHSESKPKDHRDAPETKQDNPDVLPETPSKTLIAQTPPTLSQKAILQLQSTHGNHFTQRFLRQRTTPSDTLVQRSPLSEQLDSAFASGGRDAAFRILGGRLICVDDPAAEGVLRGRLAGGDLWYGLQLLAYGSEAHWPFHLKIQKLLNMQPSDWVNSVFQMFSTASADDLKSAVQQMTEAQFNLLMSNSAMYVLLYWDVIKKLQEAHSAKLVRALAAMSDPDFLALARGMTQQQTRDFLENIDITDNFMYYQLIERFKAARLVATGESLVGQFRWRGGSGPDASYEVDAQTAWGHQNDFALWVRGLGPEPSNSSTMNCWQGVLFIAYKAGLVTRDWLVDIHTAATNAGTGADVGGANRAAGVQAYFQVLQQRMHSGARTVVPYNAGLGRRDGVIPAGHVIFIGGLNHVVYSKGTVDANGHHRVISLWVFPAHQPAALPLNAAYSFGVTQDTTLEAVSKPADVVEHAPPPW